MGRVDRRELDPAFWRGVVHVRMTLVQDAVDKSDDHEQVTHDHRACHFDVLIDDRT